MSRGPPDIGGLISCAQLRRNSQARARNPHPLRRRRSLKVDNFTYQTSKEDLMDQTAQTMQDKTPVKFEIDLVTESALALTVTF